MITLKINDKEYECKQLSDLTIHESYELNSLLDNDATEKDIIQHMSDVPIELLKHFNSSNIDYDILLNRAVPVESFFFNGRMPIAFNTLKVKEFYVLDYIVSTNQDDALTQLIIILYYSGKKAAYSLDELKTLINKEFNFNTANNLLNSFIEYRTNFYKMYEGLFSQIDDDDDDEDESEESTKSDQTETNLWGIMSFVYASVNNDFTKVKELQQEELIPFMNYLAWQKEQADIAIAAQKNQH